MRHRVVARQSRKSSSLRNDRLSFERSSSLGYPIPARKEFVRRKHRKSRRGERGGGEAMHCRFVRNSGRLYARIISVEKHSDSIEGRERRAVGITQLKIERHSRIRSTSLECNLILCSVVKFGCSRRLMSGHLLSVLEPSVVLQISLRTPATVRCPWPCSMCGCRRRAAWKCTLYLDDLLRQELIYSEPSGELNFWRPVQSALLALGFRSFADIPALKELAAASCASCSNAGFC